MADGNGVFESQLSSLIFQIRFIGWIPFPCCPVSVQRESEILLIKTYFYTIDLDICHIVPFHLAIMLVFSSYLLVLYYNLHNNAYIIVYPSCSIILIMLQ